MKIISSLFSLILFVSCSGTIKSTIIEKDFFHQKKVLIIRSAYSNYIPFKMGNVNINIGTGGSFATYTPSKIQNSIKTNSMGNIDILIKNELEKRGFFVDIADNIKNIDNYDLLVEYQDTWKWDFKDYMPYLEIYFINAKTMKTNAIIYFENNSEIHDYPAPEKKIPQMIDDLFKKIEKSK